MSRFRRRDKTTPIDPLIAELLLEMQKVGVSSPQYPKMLESLTKLYEMKTKERRNPVSGDTVLLVVGNLVGILLIVVYEQKHVLSSKGLGQLIRPRT